MLYRTVYTGDSVRNIHLLASKYVAEMGLWTTKHNTTCCCVFTAKRSKVKRQCKCQTVKQVTFEVTVTSAFFTVKKLLYIMGKCLHRKPNIGTWDTITHELSTGVHLTIY